MLREASSRLGQAVARLLPVHTFPSLRPLLGCVLRLALRWGCLACRDMVCFSQSALHSLVSDTKNPRYHILWGVCRSLSWSTGTVHIIMYMYLGSQSARLTGLIFGLLSPRPPNHQIKTSPNVPTIQYWIAIVRHSFCIQEQMWEMGNRESDCVIPSHPGADQGLLNTYWGDWATKDIKYHLPFIYNMVANAHYGYAHAYRRWALRTCCAYVCVCAVMPLNAVREVWNTQHYSS